MEKASTPSSEGSPRNAKRRGYPPRYIRGIAGTLIGKKPRKISGVENQNLLWRR